MSTRPAARFAAVRAAGCGGGGGGLTMCAPAQIRVLARLAGGHPAAVATINEEIEGLIQVCAAFAE